jgi:hypothetical protein
MPAVKSPQKSASPSPTLKIPELEHAKEAALGSLVSLHSRRAYKNAIDKFIAWYCSEPRLGFNRAVSYDIARSLNSFHCRLLPSIFICPQSAVWPMRLRRAAC